MDEKLQKGFKQVGKGPDFEGPKSKDIAGLSDEMVPVKAHVRGKSGSTQPGHPAKKRQPSSMKFMD